MEAKVAFTHAHPHHNGSLPKVDRTL